MRANVKKVLDAWAVGLAANGDSKKTVWTDGETVYSYAMPIAKRQRGGHVFIVQRDSAPSSTTRSQIDALHVFASQQGWTVVHSERLHDPSTAHGASLEAVNREVRAKRRRRS